MRKDLTASTVIAAMLSMAGPVFAASDNPFGLVYANAIRENAPGKV